MKFNHANFVVADPQATALFFSSHFGFRVLGEPNDKFIIMEGSDGFVLNVMNAGKDAADYPRNFHVGFFVADIDAVRAKFDELVHAGYGPGEVRELRRDGNLTTTFYCTAPGGFLVEIAHNG